MRTPEPSRLHRALVASFGLASAAVIAWACGPEFTQLIGNTRPAFLKAPVAYVFSEEASRLVPAPQKKLAVGPDSPPYGIDPEQRQRELDEERGKAEAIGLPAAQAERVKAMRKAAGGDAAFTLGEGLPQALRLYTAGAVDFTLGRIEPDACEGKDCEAAAAAKSPRPADDKLRLAAQRFAAVLALPAEQRRLRAAWAAFSLGRAERMMNAPDAAVAAFQRTREEARQGADDPLQLAVASLGEEARVELARGRFPRAVALYAEQAAHGSDNGRNSLRQVAERLLAQPELMQAHLADPLVQRLLLTYALASLDDDGSNPLATASSASPAASTASAATMASAASAPAAASVAGAAGAPTAASDPAAAVLAAWAATATGRGTPPIVRLLDAIVQQGAATANTLQDADRLAALAYAAGRYDLAAQLAPRSQSPLAAWISAKLALRNGNSAQAAEHYARAMRAMAAQDKGQAGPLRYRLQAEQGMLSLSRAEFVPALEQWWAMGGKYWLDLAYVAERVVTLDELKTFVDARVPATAAPPAVKSGETSQQPADAGTEWPAISPANQLRDLLARRLMREGRPQEAYAYFHGPDEQRLADPEVREHAEAYSKALQSAQRAWTQVGAAGAYFDAASLARKHGMEILGFELGPDSQAAGGSFEMGVERPSTAGGASLAEQQRYDASAPRIDQRFHYRYVAVEHAMRAAEALPPRSQAYAAVLCHAANWMFSSGNEERAQALYQRYVKQGAVVDFATHFGHDCPAPAFKPAAWMAVKLQLAQGRRWARHHKPLAWTAIAGSALLISGAALLGWRRWRSRVKTLPIASGAEPGDSGTH